MGAGTRQPLFAMEGAGGGGGRENREPGEKPRTSARPGFPEGPPPDFQQMGEKVSSSGKTGSA